VRLTRSLGAQLGAPGYITSSTVSMATGFNASEVLKVSEPHERKVAVCARPPPPVPRRASAARLAPAVEARQVPVEVGGLGARGRRARRQRRVAAQPKRQPARRQRLPPPAHGRASRRGGCCRIGLRWKAAQPPFTKLDWQPLLFMPLGERAAGRARRMGARHAPARHGYARQHGRV